MKGKLFKMGRQRSVKYDSKEHTFKFFGDLGEALEKAKRDIKSLANNLDYYKWNFEKAKKEYDSRINKIRVNQEFIKCVQENCPDWFDENGNYISGSYERSQCNGTDKK